MGEFVVNRLYPHPSAIVDAAAFPIFWMYQVNPTVLKSPSGSSAAINVLEPLNLGTFNAIKAAEISNCTLECGRKRILEIQAEPAIDFAPLHNRWNQHSQWPSLQRSNNRNRLQPESINRLTRPFSYPLGFDGMAFVQCAAKYAVAASDEVFVTCYLDLRILRLIIADSVSSLAVSQQSRKVAPPPQTINAHMLSAAELFEAQPPD